MSHDLKFKKGPDGYRAECACGWLGNVVMETRAEIETPQKIRVQKGHGPVQEIESRNPSAIKREALRHLAGPGARSPQSHPTILVEE